MTNDILKCDLCKKKRMKYEIAMYCGFDSEKRFVCKDCMDKIKETIKSLEVHNG